MVEALHWLDGVVIGIYFLAIIGSGVWSSMKNRGSVDGFFLAGRSMHFIPVGASLFASNIGSGHFIGLAGSGAASGIGTAGFEIIASFVLIILGWIFLPVYIRAGPEYIKKRFGGDRIRIYLSILSLFLYIFTKISVDLFSGAIFINLALGLNLYLSIVILLVISALFTIGGGLTAVIWTDLVQTVIMLIGAFYLMIASFIEIGGMDEMKKTYSFAVANSTIFSNSTCGLPREDYFNLVRDINSDYPWLGMLVGGSISSVWYWCSDQVIVQRALAAKNLSHAKAGCIIAGVLKFLPMFFIVLPGLVARILYTDDIACADPALCTEICSSAGGCSNIAYPTMVIKLMPIGARGLMLAVMIAALMSSLTSIFNSSSTIFTMDIWKRLRPQSKDWELMVVGRLFVLALVGISILWIPIIQANPGSRLFDYIQSLTSYFSPPICAIFVMAIFFKRINEEGAFWGLMAGFVTGLIRFILDLAYPEEPCGSGKTSVRPDVVAKMHYLHFGILLFFITCIVSWVVSLLTTAIPDKYIKRLTFFTIYDENEPVPIPSTRGFGRTGFCARANLDESNVENFNYEMGETNGGFVDDEKKIEYKEENKNNIYDVPVRMNPVKKAFYFICGIESELNKSNTPKVEHKMDTSIDELPKYAMLNNISAIIVLGISGFYVAFFNKYN